MTDPVPTSIPVHPNPNLPLRVLSLRAEGFKRLRAVEITPSPTGTVVELRGPNGAGKSSVLDALWSALGGADASPGRPINLDAQTATIRVDLGEIVVTRRFRPRTVAEGAMTGDPRQPVPNHAVTTDLRVEAASGARFPSPQHLLDGLVGAIAFDPLAFARSRPQKQLTQLRALVPDLSARLADLDAEIAAAFAARTDANREVGRLRAVLDAGATTLPAEAPNPLPVEPVDEAELTAELAAASTANALLERRRAGRTQVETDLQRHLDEAADLEGPRLAGYLARQMSAHEARLASIDGRLASLRQELAAVETERRTVVDDFKTALDADRARYLGEAAAARDRATDLRARLDAAEPLPDPIDVDAIAARITAARASNAWFRAATLQRERRDELNAASATATALADEIAALRDRRTALLAAAPLPVPGLDLTPTELLLNGVPFEQASTAERVRVSAAVAMAMNPRLRVIAVRDGSLLDRPSRALLQELAAEHGYQLWLELTDDATTSSVSSPSSTVVLIEDGTATQLPSGSSC